MARFTSWRTSAARSFRVFCRYLPKNTIDSSITAPATRVAVSGSAAS